ncbi:MAG: cytochrome-c oxidase, cbb3-type subunit III [Magnetococcales bacterium]|nr:cytochrome-c oxidase, cbb3-type subunit III [Magnetococcales bacterium]
MATQPRDQKKQDQQPGDVSTTGHQWDNDEGYPLQEYNNPLPKWWLYTFYATIVYAIVYWVLYPAWPLANGFTKGLLASSMYQELAQEEAAAKATRQPLEKQLADLSLEEIARNNNMLQFAMSSGKAVFGDNCAPCHGTGGVGAQAKGFPILVDDDWLYGGTLAAIQESITNGRNGQMPAHLQTAGGNLSVEQVNDLTQFVLSLSQRANDSVSAQRGRLLFSGEASCHSCHGDHGKGSLLDTVGGQPLDHGIGAPNLTDKIWLHGGDVETIRTSIAKGRSGQMPAWGGPGGRLSPLDIKAVTLYVHTLGGGQKK